MFVLCNAHFTCAYDQMRESCALMNYVCHLCLQLTKSDIESNHSNLGCKAERILSL